MKPRPDAQSEQAAPDASSLRLRIRTGRLARRDAYPNGKGGVDEREPDEIFTPLDPADGEIEFP